MRGTVLEYSVEQLLIHLDDQDRGLQEAVFGVTEVVLGGRYVDRRCPHIRRLFCGTLRRTCHRKAKMPTPFELRLDAAFKPAQHPYLRVLMLTSTSFILCFLFHAGVPLRLSLRFPELGVASGLAQGDLKPQVERCQPCGRQGLIVLRPARANAPDACTVGLRTFFVVLL